MTNNNINTYAGTWQLASFEYRDKQGTVIHPYGEDAIGYLMIGQDQHMAVSFATSVRPLIASGNLAQASTEERNAACKTYFSYMGKTHIIESGNEAATPQVETKVLLSLLPNWTGKTHTRTLKYDGKYLSFITPPDIIGKGFSAYLTFERI